MKTIGDAALPADPCGIGDATLPADPSGIGDAAVGDAPLPADPSGIADAALPTDCSAILAQCTSPLFDALRTAEGAVRSVTFAMTAMSSVGSTGLLMCVW